MRALVIDDEELVLDGFEAFLLASLPELSLDKSSDLTVALNLAASVKYSFVVLDWHLVGPDRRAVEAEVVVRALRGAASQAPIVVVSGDQDRNWRDTVFQMGLSGFVPKGAPGRVLMDAVHVALHGGVYLPSTLLLEAIQSPYRKLPTGPAGGDPRERFPELTARQCDVFKVMMTGVGDKQIARELGIAESTVKTHVCEILAKVGVTRRSEAISRALGTANGRLG